MTWLNAMSGAIAGGQSGRFKASKGEGDDGSARSVLGKVGNVSRGARESVVRGSCGGLCDVQEAFVVVADDEQDLFWTTRALPPVSDLAEHGNRNQSPLLYFTSAVQSTSGNLHSKLKTKEPSQRRVCGMAPVQTFSYANRPPSPSEYRICYGFLMLQI